MSFVDDDEIPGAGGDGRQDLRPLHEVDRRDGNRERRPEVQADRQRGGPLAGVAPIDDGRVDAEALRELAGPLVAEAGRDEHERARHRAARLQF
jgi:hypothetical protein